MDGLDPEHLRSQIELHKPKMLFATPSFTNPSGILWSLERRRAVLDLCIAYNILIVEDDSYGDLHFQKQGEHKLPKDIRLCMHWKISAMADMCFISVRSARPLRPRCGRAGRQAAES